MLLCSIFIFPNLSCKLHSHLHRHHTAVPCFVDAHCQWRASLFLFLLHSLFSVYVFSSESVAVMVQRSAPKSSLDLLCALAPGDAIVSELVANDLRIENEKVSLHLALVGGVFAATACKICGDWCASE